MYKSISKIYSIITHIIPSLNIVTLLLATPCILLAQNHNLEGLEEVLVVAPYNPNIHSATAIKEIPLKDTSHSQPIPMPYIQSPQAQLQKVPIQTIKAVEYRLPKPSNHFLNYARLGYGTAHTADVEILLNHQIQDIKTGAYIQHRSANPNINNRPKAQYAQSAAEVFAQWGDKDWTSLLKLNFARQQHHYYGFNTDDYDYNNSDVDSMKQIYTQGGLSWDGNLKQGKYHLWHIASSYNFLKTHTGNAKEHHIIADIDYQNTTKLTQEKQYWGIQLHTNTSGTDFGHETLWLGAYTLSPYYAWKWSEWSLKLGTNLMMGKEEDNHFNIAPLLNLTYSLANTHAQLYISSKGYIYPNHLHHLSPINPYISPIVKLQNTRTPVDINIGLRGSLFNARVDYNWKTGYAQHKNMPLFVIDSSSLFNNSFEVLYDDINTISTQLQLAYKYNNWEAHSQISYVHYSPKTQKKAWHQAPFILHTRLYYNLNKWRLGTVWECHSSRYAYIPRQNTSYKLKAWADISLLADYKLNEHLSLYAHIYNVFNTEYSAFHLYKTQGRTALAGLKFVF